jgi:uncharacterized membrane protein YkoI
MKISITENQLDYIKNQEIYKNILFKYWDKTGPKITDTTAALFNIDYHRGTLNKTGVKMSDVQKWLTEYIGFDKAKEIALNFFNKDFHTIDDCGGYNFNFKVYQVEINENECLAKILVDATNGTVTLVMVDNREVNLRDAIDNNDYGWEIESELEDCIFEYIAENVENITGLSFVIDSVRYGKI